MVHPSGGVVDLIIRNFIYFFSYSQRSKLINHFNDGAKVQDGNNQGRMAHHRRLIL